VGFKGLETFYVFILPPQSMASRKANDYETIEQWNAPSNLSKEHPIMITGFDKEGCPGKHKHTFN
jgi:hypothetical protein